MAIILILSIFLIIILSAVSFTLYKILTKVKSDNQKGRHVQKLVLSFLQEIGTAFKDNINLNDLMQSVVNSSIRMLSAESGAIFLTDKDKKYLQAVAIEGTFPPWQQPEQSIMEKILSKTRFIDEYLRGQRISVGTGIIGATAENGEPCLIPDGSLDVRIPKSCNKMTEIRTIMVVPLKIKTEVLGVLALANKSDNQQFNATDLALLMALGDQAAIAIRNATFYQTIIEKQKLDHDLVIAKDVQNTLLPKTFPKINGWDIGAWNISAKEIGGDYYDFINVGQDMLGVVIADVSGKSIPGALVMNSTRSLLRSKAVGVNSASNVLMSVNEILCQDTDLEIFISLLYLVINLKNRIITFARAGHEPMILYRAKEGTCELLKSEGMVLGVESGPLFNNKLQDMNIELNTGDMLVLYTDGVTEAVNKKGEEFGINNLMDAVRISSLSDASGIIENIIERISRFTGDIPQQDDLTLVVLKVK